MKELQISRYLMELINIRLFQGRIHGLVRRIINRCAHCRLRHAVPMNQLMSQLPSYRMLHHEPSSTAVTIDYFEPLLVKRGCGTEKRYGCLFTCSTRRAVHLEVSHSLDIGSFSCAFSRFVGRRRCSRRVYSDNGTNSSGAKAELESRLANWNHDRIVIHMVERQCGWLFTPPKTSHWGAVWERMIQSVRRVISLLLRNQLVTD